MYVFII